MNLNYVEVAPVSPMIREIPEDERPREKLLSRGPSALSNAEIIALFFGTGRPGKSAIDLGRELIERFGSLRGVSRATVEQLREIDGIGPAKAAQLSAVFEFGKRLGGERFENDALDTPESVAELLGAEMARLNQESLRVVLLNTRLRLIQVVEVTRGLVDCAMFHPREALKAAVQFSASAFILVHNHPSGDPSPSTADLEVTKSLREAAKVMSIDFVDHVILGESEGAGRYSYYSFKESGLL